MEIDFKTNRLEKDLTNLERLYAQYGNLARKINQRIKELKDADTLAVFKHIPAARCHELKGNKKGKLAVSVSSNYRLIFEPNYEIPPKNENGGLNWDEVKKIKVIGIEDYHK